MALALIVHGGSGDIPDDEVEPHRRGAEQAARAGWQVLLQGGTALDAVEAAIVVMEDDPAFDAGTGSVLNRDGEVEMDASFMDGRTLDAGAVAGVMRVKNPIRLARRVIARTRQIDLELIFYTSRSSAESDHAVGQIDRLVDFVRDKEHRLPGPAPDAQQFTLHDLAGLRVERGERLVHDENFRVDGQRPGQIAALLHAA